MIRRVLPPRFGGDKGARQRQIDEFEVPPVSALEAQSHLRLMPQGAILLDRQSFVTIQEINALPKLARQHELRLGRWHEKVQPWR